MLLLGELRILTPHFEQPAVATIWWGLLPFEGRCGQIYLQLKHSVLYFIFVKLWTCHSKFYRLSVCCSFTWHISCDIISSKHFVGQNNAFLTRTVPTVSVTRNRRLSACLRFISDIEGARVGCFLSTTALLLSYVSNTIRRTHRISVLNCVIKYRVIQNDCRGVDTSLSRCNPKWFLFMGLRQGSGLCSSSSAGIPELKVRIRPAIETITADMLQTIWNELDYRVESQRVHI
jgi:hypothetical protein